MKRFVILLLTAVLALTMPLSALAAGQIEVTEDISVSDDYDWTRFKGQNVTLNVYNWGEYISNGSDDSVDVVAAFEKLTGIKVNYTTFDSNESLYAKLKSGAANYDVIIPSDYMVAKMISEGMLMPLDYSNIPNFQNIDEEYRNGDYDPENAYTVPYTLCTTGIIYNTKMVDEAPTSWADLWDEKYAGNILMFNNSRDAYAIGAFKSGSSVNPQTTEEVDAVVDELKAQKPLVQAYVMDEIFDKMIGGEAAVGVYYSGDAITMIDDNPDLAWVSLRRERCCRWTAWPSRPPASTRKPQRCSSTSCVNRTSARPISSISATPPLCTVYGRFWMKTSSTARSRTPPRTLRPKKRCSLP